MIYLKANYPVEYMAALMSCAMGNTDKLAEYLEECRQMKIEVLPPDVNESDLDFKVVGDKIRFGLGAVKGVGEKAVLRVIDARKRIGGSFESLFQFCEEIDSKSVDRKVCEQFRVTLHVAPHEPTTICPFGADHVIRKPRP